MRELSPDVVVIGAGVVGALIAHRLAKRGFRVLVLDRRRPCRGATAATFAWTSAHGKRPLFYHRFNLASIERFPALADELGVEIGWRPCFSIKPLLDVEDLEESRREVSDLRREGYQLSWLSGDEARERVSLLSPDVVGCSFCEGEGTVESFRLVFTALAAARDRGAVLCWDEEVTGIETEAGRITAVRTPAGTIPCGAVVNAAGTGAQRIGQLAGVEVPVQTIKGQMLVTEKLPLELEGIVAEIQQTPSGSFLIGVSWEPGETDVATGVSQMRTMARRACQLIPALSRARVVRSFAGVRPVPPDDISILGPTAEVEGLIWAVTHSGVTLAPLMSEIVADFVEGTEPHPDWDSRLSPERFLGGGS